MKRNSGLIREAYRLTSFNVASGIFDTFDTFAHIGNQNWPRTKKFKNFYFTNNSFSADTGSTNLLLGSTATWNVFFEGYNAGDIIYMEFLNGSNWSSSYFTNSTIQYNYSLLSTGIHNNVQATISKTISTSSGPNNSTESFYLRFSRDGFSTNILTTLGPYFIRDPSISLNYSTMTLNENLDSNTNLTWTATYIRNTTTLYYTIDSTSPGFSVANDLQSPASSSGSISRNWATATGSSTSAAQTSITTFTTKASDFITEGVETFNYRVRWGNTSGPIMATLTVTILDTSQTVSAVVSSSPSAPPSISFLQAFSVPQDGAPLGLFFKPDGTKMYVVGIINDYVNEYDLSTAWDISTAVFLQNFSVAAQEDGSRGLFFKPDGTKMYVIGTAGVDVNEYDLSTAWDISTAVFLQNFSVAAQETSPEDVFFKPDGTKMYIIGSIGEAVNEYDLSTAWDVSSAVFLQSFSVVAQETASTGLFFKPDGTKMYTIGLDGDAVYEYDLSTAWDISTAVFLQNFSVLTQENFSHGLFFKDDGTKMYVLGTGGDAVYEYDLPSAWDISVAGINIDEGNTITFTVDCTSSPTIPSTLNWDLQNMTLTDGYWLSSDIVGSTSGTVNIVDGIGTIQITANSDTFTEGTESFRIRIYGPLGNMIANSSNITINDTSTGTTETAPVAAGQVQFTSPGTYNWTVPPGITEVSAVVIGGGGGGAATNALNGISGGGGAGGGLHYRTFSVTPGEILDIGVGAGGSGGTAAGNNNATGGGQSYIIRGDVTYLVRAGGGQSGRYNSSGTAGKSTGGLTFSGDLGGGGGAGGQGGGGSGGNVSGGGGGAGGYSGSGGRGSTFNAEAPTAGSGGGGAGSYGVNSFTSAITWGAGGVNIYGEKTSGTSFGTFTGSGTSAYTSSSSGQSQAGSYSSSTFSKNFGGGGAGAEDDSPAAAGSGGGGAVRIIWGDSNITRNYPSTNTDNV